MIEKGQGGIIETLTKPGAPYNKYRSQIADVVSTWQFCEHFKCTPRQYREDFTFEDRQHFKAIMQGMLQAQSDKG